MIDHAADAYDHVDEQTDLDPQTKAYVTDTKEIPPVDPTVLDQIIDARMNEPDFLTEDVTPPVQADNLAAELRHLSESIEHAATRIEKGDGHTKPGPFSRNVRTRFRS